MNDSKHSLQIQREEHDNTQFAKRVSMVSSATVYVITQPISLATVDVQIGAVEIKNFDTDDRAKVTTDNELLTAINSSATIYAVVNTGAAGQSSVVLDAGSEYVGLATVDIGAQNQVRVTDGTEILAINASNQAEVSVESNTAWADPGTFIGLSTVVVGSSIPAGSNNIGDVDIASNTAWADPGTFVGLTTTVVGSALPAGDNNIGNVDLASAIPAGDNNIGNVDIASAIPAGANFIGLTTVVDAAPTAVVQGMVSSASGGLVQFPANSVQWVTVRAANGNATTCYVGSSSATINNGYFLDGGDSVGFAVNNTNLLYLVGVDDSEVRFVGA